MRLGFVRVFRFATLRALLDLRHDDALGQVSRVHPVNRRDGPVQTVISSQSRRHGERWRESITVENMNGWLARYFPQVAGFGYLPEVLPGYSLQVDIHAGTAADTMSGCKT